MSKNERQSQTNMSWLTITIVSTHFRCSGVGVASDHVKKGLLLSLTVKNIIKIGEYSNGSAAKICSLAHSAIDQLLVFPRRWQSLEDMQTGLAAKILASALFALVLVSS